MEIKTVVISTEMIKPSSPTPKSQQKHRLSFLDQITPLDFMPLVYFYASNTKIPNSEKSNRLKKCLSQVLSRCYPVAGRNDGGAPFIEAEANRDLSKAITNPDTIDMSKFLPYKLNEPQDFCVAVQATFFRCGGVAVGLIISRKLSFFEFANAWSAVAGNGDGGGGPLPKFDAATYFPPLDITRYKSSKEAVKEEITRIFTFSAARIDGLRESHAYGDGCMPQRRPTEVEALSAFIRTRFISATGAKAKPNPNTVHNTVDHRSRIDPPLSVYHFVNIFRLGTATPAVGDSCVEVMKKVWEANRAVDSGYIANLKDSEKYFNFIFASLLRLPFYETDFGWGKPARVGLAEFGHKNMVLFMNARNGDGIEAWIHLGKEDMEKFEADLELRKFLLRDKRFLISKI